MIAETGVGAIVLLAVIIGGLLGRYLTYRREQADIRSEARPRKGGMT